MDPQLVSQLNPENLAFANEEKHPETRNTSLVVRPRNRNVAGPIDDEATELQSPASPVIEASRESQEWTTHQSLPIPLEPTPVSPTVLDTDAGNADQEEFSTEYAEDILAYSLQLEEQYTIEAGFLLKHPSIRPQMRMRLVDWFVALQMHFGLQQDTLQMAVSVLDRFMSAINYEVVCERYQLVGAACMLIAYKYVETNQPTAGDLADMCDGACTLEDILRTESIILNKLQFQLGQPLSAYFLRRFSNAAGLDLTTCTLAKYLLELALYEYSLAHCRPSALAAAALSVAAEVTEVAQSEKTMQPYGHYQASDLDFISSKLVELAASAEENPDLQTSHKKYASDKFCRISQMVGQSWSVLSMNSRKRQRI